MSNFRSVILIIGLALFFVASALLTVLILYVSGVILTDPIELVYSVDNVEKVYDGEPLTADNYRLESGEILEGHTAEVVIKGSQTDAGTGESTLEVKVFDKNGFDVSKEYSVKVVSGKLTVKPQDITVSIRDTQVVYNGLEVDFEKYDLLEGSLAAGHRIAASSKASMVNVGDRLDIQALQPLVFNAQGASVTQNYNITFNSDSVEIIARPIKIVPENVTYVYDGTVVSADKFTLTAGTLVSGHSAEVRLTTTDGGAAEAQNVSRTHIKVGSVTITDESGANVTANYDIDFSETAYLTITKKPITVVLNYISDGYVYSGEEITPSATDAVSEEDKLKWSLDADDIEIVTRGDAVNAGLHEYTANYLNEYGNYEITFIPGTYNIQKKSVTLSATDKQRSVVYGGTYDFDASQELECEEYSVTAATYTVKNDLINRLQIFSISGATVKNGNNVDITSNLEINYDGLNVAVQLSQRNLKFTYDECDAETYYMNPNIIYGHVFYTLAQNDTIEFEVSIETTSFRVDIGSVRIVNLDGQDVTNLYNIDVGEGGAFKY